MSAGRCLHDCWQVTVEGPSVSHHEFSWQYFLMILQAAGGWGVHRLRNFWGDDIESWVKKAEREPMAAHLHLPSLAFCPFFWWHIHLSAGIDGSLMGNRWKRWIIVALVCKGIEKLALFFNLYFWLCWVFVVACRLSLVTECRLQITKHVWS